MDSGLIFYERLCSVIIKILTAGTHSSWLSRLAGRLRRDTAWRIPTKPAGTNVLAYHGCPCCKYMKYRSHNLASQHLLCHSVILKVMRLILNKLSKRGAPPRMVHRWDIFLFWLLSRLLRIQILRGRIAFRYFFQSIDLLVIDAAVQGAVKRLDHHRFRAIAVVYLQTTVIQHPVMLVLKSDAVSTVYRAFV